MEGFRISKELIHVNGIRASDAHISSLLCEACGLLMRNPTQVTTCGCRYCDACVKFKLENKAARCVCDRHEEPFKSSEVRKDIACLRDIERLEVRCGTPDHPCEWEGRVEGYRIHCEHECEHFEKDCPNGCPVRGNGKMLGNHVKECPKRKEICPECDEQVCLDEREHHLDSRCPMLPVDCPHCSETIQLRKDLLFHEKHSCPEALVSCPVRQLCRCKEKMKRSTLSQHMCMEHSAKIAGELHAAATNAEREASLLKREVQQLKKEQNKMLRRLDAHAADCTSCRSPNVHEELEDFGSLPAGRSTHIETGIQKLIDTVIKLKTDQEAIIKELAINCDICNTVERRMDMEHAMTYQGSFLWPIPQIAKRRRGALSGKIISLYSAPFFSSLYGYKMCLRVYLNGDGSGQKTHLFLFAILMKSDHDGILTFPLDCWVKMIIVSQSEQVKDISEEFRSDRSSRCFERPKTEMNSGAGLPKFAPLSILQNVNYVKDDMLYVRCEVREITANK